VVNTTIPRLYGRGFAVAVLAVTVETLGAGRKW
jgi:hypothetical protein